MHWRIIWIGIILPILVQLKVEAQYFSEEESYPKHLIGSTMFLLGNLSTKNKPDFVQLNYGYRLTGKDVVSIELKTWKYAWSLGIPYGDSFENPKEKFPGYIREYGAALIYQRYFWRGLYGSLHVMAARQCFVNNNDVMLRKGFQLFNTYRMGYHIKLFKDRFFIQPSIATTHRLYHTEMPNSFKKMDDRWGKFFFGEPGLHFGFNF